MPQSARNQFGFSTFFIVFLVVVLALMIVNFFGSVVKEEDIYGPSPTPTVSFNTNSCCENAECDPTKTSKSFDFTKPNGVKERYGLLKSQVTLKEFNAWLKDSNEKTPDGDPIILNASDTERFCGNGDQVWGGENPNTACTPIADDAMLYVCKENCGVTDRSSYRVCQLYGQVPCYGNADTVYDVYYSIPVYNQTGSVPDVIKKCNNTISTGRFDSKQIIVSPSPTTGKELQLRNFEIINVPLNKNSTPWMSPWCKPAIYLYPPQKTDINVQVFPVGQMTTTIPQYPVGGWKVTAYPDGRINSGQDVLSYLYYEAQIPDEKINKPTKGFVRKQSEVGNLLNEILPKLGLNLKESEEFIKYWTTVLPKQPSYYFVGIIPQEELDKLAPLNINPVPNKIIRVTIYFQALDGPINIESPTFTTPTRDGFTVVEWGGIFKKDPKYPFSCFM